MKWSKKIDGPMQLLQCGWSIATKNSIEIIVDELIQKKQLPIEIWTTAVTRVGLLPRAADSPSRCQAPEPPHLRDWSAVNININHQQNRAPPLSSPSWYIRFFSYPPFYTFHTFAFTLCQLKQESQWFQHRYKYWKIIDVRDKSISRSSVIFFFFKVEHL